MITVIIPDLRSKAIALLQRRIDWESKQRREWLRERERLINHLKDFKDMADLPEDHAVSKLLRLEQDDEV